MIALAALFLTAWPHMTVAQSDATEARPKVGSLDDAVYGVPHVYAGQLDLHDGSIEDWYALGLSPNFTGADLVPTAASGTGARMSPPDLSVTVFLAWSQHPPRLYAAIQSSDDVYVNAYDGAQAHEMWRYDGVQLMVDGDHSGGEYHCRSGR